LLIAIAQFMYLLYQRQVWKQAAGAIGILMALVYMLKTGSRGAFLAFLVLVLVCIAFGKHRSRLLLVGVPVALATLVIVPSSTFHRLSLIALSPETIAIRESTDIGAVDSQVQRMALFRQSVTYALTHPLFGVGPGQFAVATFGDSEKTGVRANWLGTHNSYTQVASECGIPAFILYVSVIGISLVSTFRIFRRTAHLPEHGDLNAIAFCYFGAALVYAISTFFFHIAYSDYLPGIAGMTVALRLATSRRLWNSSLSTTRRLLLPACAKLSLCLKKSAGEC
jgi:O-antigen ligase